MHWRVQLNCCLNDSATMLVDRVLIDITSELFKDDAVVSIGPTCQMNYLLDNIVAILITIKLLVINIGVSKKIV